MTRGRQVLIQNVASLMAEIAAAADAIEVLEKENAELKARLAEKKEPNDGAQ